MSDPQRSVESAAEDVSMVMAMELLVQTIRKIHSVFIGLAIGVPVLLVLFMGISVLVITHVIWSAEERMVRRLDTLPERIKSSDVHQTQTVTLPEHRDLLEKYTDRMLANPELYKPTHTGVR